MKNFFDDIKITDEALNDIVTVSGGDLRSAYNLLEVAYYSTSDFNITRETIKNINRI